MLTHPPLLVAIALVLSMVGCDAESSPSDQTSASSGGAPSGGGGGSGTGGGLAGGSGVTGGTGAVGAVGGSGGEGGEDPCAKEQPRCPDTPSGLASGSGLLAIDRCAFPMAEQGFDVGPNSAVALLGAALTPRTIVEVLSDLNRVATTETSVPGNPGGVTQAFGWNGGDQNVDYWIPQGLTGSADATTSGLVAGREVVLASWYYEGAQDPGSTIDKGVRISIADVTNPVAVSYRHLMLVEPVVVGAAQPDFKAVSVHAGGVVWFDDYLYVADTVHGFRVFDMARISEVATGKDDVIGFDATSGQYHAANYKYVVPQVGSYERQGACAPRFSFVGLDRSTSPPSLISGEYDASSLFGRLFHWPLKANAKLSPATSFPSKAFFSLHSHLQGAVSNDGVHFLSSSEPPAGHGDLYVAAEGTTSAIVGWVDAPEDLLFDVSRKKLWGLSEGNGARYVFAVSPPP